MSSNIKLVAATAVAPAAMSVRSAELGALKPASLVALKGRNLSAYAETDARVISVGAAAMRRRGQGIGLASNVERGWHDSERMSAVTPDARPLASAVTACEQQQVEGMAHAVGTAGFAGLHGYPSWRTRT
ncbi:hypothetical protein LO772_12845 [Yinghuangia sp. ASG 101]|uniref:hypothetical protein n=1 Tax=Yinghuangia sp. ASG 101 TaxID=2896848 RepID=UPI001E5864EB|nr:hypothetical protein [Yinghuangia sp. ASG 101]UGQ14390.1 hypothetical protein LO772_12845 [Yinghuangia sp. ASG 101]